MSQWCPSRVETRRAMNGGFIQVKLIMSPSYPPLVPDDFCPEVNPEYNDKRMAENVAFWETLAEDHRNPGNAG